MEKRQRAATRYSDPWPCPNCSDPDEICEGGSDNVIYEVRDGWARCPRCGYGDRRSAFGFATHTVPPATETELSWIERTLAEGADDDDEG